MRRRAGWRPAAGPAAGGAAVEVEGNDEAAEGAPGGLVQGPGGVVSRWCKSLPTSDAQQPAARQRIVKRPRTRPTNVTGNLRLTQAGFEIEANRYFREELFGDAEWVPVEGRDEYEQAHIPFWVEKDGAWEKHTLRVDYDVRRADHANEPTTVIKWGPVLRAWLRGHNRTGEWVVIEKDVEGAFWLSFRAEKPEWAP